MSSRSFSTAILVDGRAGLLGDVAGNTRGGAGILEERAGIHRGTGILGEGNLILGRGEGILLEGAATQRRKSWNSRDKE